MAMLPSKANTPDNNEGMGDRTPLPAGDYIAAIIKTEFKQTKAKTGHYLSVHWKVQSPEAHKGRMFFSNLNLDNPNPIAVEIAQKELNSICQAMGLVGVEDSVELHDIPITATLKVKPGDAQWPPSNEIVGFAPADGVKSEKKVPSFMEKPSNAGTTEGQAGQAAEPAKEESVPAQQKEAVPAPSDADAPAEKPAKKKLPWE